MCIYTHAMTYSAVAVVLKENQHAVAAGRDVAQAEVWREKHAHEFLDKGSKSVGKHVHQLLVHLQHSVTPSPWRRESGCGQNGCRLPERCARSRYRCFSSGASDPAATRVTRHAPRNTRRTSNLLHFQVLGLQATSLGEVVGKAHDLVHKRGHGPAQSETRSR